MIQLPCKQYLKLHNFYDSSLLVIAFVVIMQSLTVTMSIRISNRAFCYSNILACALEQFCSLLFLVMKFSSFLFGHFCHQFMLLC